MGRNRNRNIVELKTMLVSQYENYKMDFIYFKCTFNFTEQIWSAITIKTFLISL